MLNRLKHTWVFVRQSLWFVPALMGAAAIALAILLLSYGRFVPGGGLKYWLLYSGDAENARELMSALLSGMITMFSLVVSITMVVLTLAAGQIGPRLVRNFMGDRTTQAVLGLFLADILYLLVVFRTIDGNMADGIPHLAVTVGTVATALCLFVLLFYIHKLARSIVYDTVVRDVALDQGRRVERLLPREDCPPPPALGSDFAWIALEDDGYVQGIDLDALMRISRKAEAVLRLEVRPGQFALAHEHLVAVHPASARTEDLVQAVRGAFTLGSERTPHQDVEYGIRQMVEMAVRALSPGLNDTFTALAVIDNLASVLGPMLARGLEPRSLADQDGAVRIVRVVPDHEGMVAASFAQIRQAGERVPAAMIRLADTIGRVAPCARTAPQRAALLKELDAVLEAAKESFSASADLETLRARHAQAAGALERPAP